MKKAIAFILVLFLLGGCAFAYVNRGNISSLVAAWKYSDTDLEEKIRENDKQLKDSVESYLGEQIRDYSDEEKQQLEDGVVTEKEVIAHIIGEKAKSETVPDKSKAEAIISGYISRLYALEGQYIGSIEGVISSAISEYSELPAAERGNSAKVRIMQKYTSSINSLEAACDSRVAAIISELKSELTAINADTSIIKKIKNAYNEEKSLKKAYYINKYM